MAQQVNVQYVQFYTQGSAARRIAPKPAVRTDTLPQIKKRKLVRVYIDPVAILGTLVAVCMLIMMAVGVSQLRNEQQKTVEMEQYVARLQIENRQLKAEYAVQCDLEAVEQTALALGMIPQQEAVHIPITVEVPQVEEPVSMWQRIGTFLTGLFA